MIKIPFRYCVVENKLNEKKEVEDTVYIRDGIMMAKDQQNAAIKIAASLKADLDLDNVEIVVVPFN